MLRRVQPKAQGLEDLDVHLLPQPSDRCAGRPVRSVGPEMLEDVRPRVARLLRPLRGEGSSLQAALAARGELGVAHLDAVAATAISPPSTTTAHPDCTAHDLAGTIQPIVWKGGLQTRTAATSSRASHVGRYLVGREGGGRSEPTSGSAYALGMVTRLRATKVSVLPHPQSVPQNGPSPSIQCAPAWQVPLG